MQEDKVYFYLNLDEYITYINKELGSKYKPIIILEEFLYVFEKYYYFIIKILISINVIGGKISYGY